MANGEVLDTLEEKITLALQSSQLRKADRTMLEIQQLFVIYLKSDHKKIEEAYPLVMKHEKRAVEVEKDVLDDKKYYTRLAIGTVIGSLFGAATTALIGWLAYAFQIKPILDALTAGK